jgi:hypothetical protein
MSYILSAVASWMYRERSDKIKGWDNGGLWAGGNR